MTSLLPSLIAVLGLIALAAVAEPRVRVPAPVLLALAGIGWALVPALRPIVIDPTIAFGRPVVDRSFVSTRSILERIDAGESIDDVANDYELSVEAVEEAVLFERAA